MWRRNGATSSSTLSSLFQSKAWEDRGWHRAQSENVRRASLGEWARELPLRKPNLADAGAVPGRQVHGTGWRERGKNWVGWADWHIGKLA